MGERERILVVDDEPQIRRFLTLSLSRQEYRVEAVETGDAALTKLSSGAYDLVLLDLGLPDMDGLDLCREIRTWSTIPIIILSVRSQDREKVAALDAGADDYVTKPFSIEELLARVRSSLRRRAGDLQPNTVCIGSLTVDFARRLVTNGNTPIHLTPTEYDLLRILVTNVGRVITHRDLLRQVRGPAYEDDRPILRVHMVALRHKLGISTGRPGYITTEPGVGYRLIDE